jgi:hypothetical protein
MKPKHFNQTKLHFFTALFLFISLSSCSDESFDRDNFDPDGWDSSSFDQFVPEFTGEKEVGDYFQGGIIIALDITGEHGLIAAIEDQSITDPWYNGEFVETDARSTEDGFDNTQKIIRAQGPVGTYAAKLCADYKNDGFDDWYLPSKEELNILYQNKDLFENLVDQLYWSSTEYEIGSAWVQDFTSGDQHLDNTSDRASVHTRAVRKF